jgi:predicted ABC-type transport system involved in lysophospholipase L1 biosynthesis ATPase subunit
MVTHDRELAERIPRLEEVRDGRLVAAGQIDARLTSRH